MAAVALDDLLFLNIAPYQQSVLALTASLDLFAGIPAVVLFTIDSAPRLEVGQ